MPSVLHKEDFTKERIQELKSRMKGSTNTVKEALAEVPYPQNNEPMLVHPSSKAVVKLRDNGCIDIFTDGNQGIRIDANNKTINNMAENIKNHAKIIRSIVTKDVIYDVKSAWTLNCKDATINTKGHTKVNADGNTEIKTKGKTIVESKGNMSLESAGKLSMKAASLDIHVSGKLNAYASSYEFT